MFSEEENKKPMELGFDELKGLVEGIGKGDLSIITKGMKGQEKEDKQSKDCNNFEEFNAEKGTMDAAIKNSKLTEEQLEEEMKLQEEIMKLQGCSSNIAAPEEFGDFDIGESQTDKKMKNTPSEEKKNLSKSFREDKKGLTEALNKLSGNDDQQLSGLAKSFQGILGSGDEADNSEFKKKQQQFLDMLSDSLIDLLTAQFKFLEALNMKQNIAITKKALEDLKKGKDGKIPIEQVETAIEVSKENKVMIDEAIASNKTITEESKEIFSSGLVDYGRGTRKIVNVGYASKQYLSNVDGFGMGMLGNLEGIVFLVENIPPLTKTFLASTDSLIQYSTNNNIPVPEEISSVQKDKAAGEFAGYN